MNWSVIKVADVKWIKITTDIFSDEKMLLIEQLPDADTIIVIWFKLLCMAGRDNNNGIFLMNNKLPYTEEMFATLFRRPLNTVRLAMATFEAYGMIDIIDDVFTLVNWEKHQNLEGLEKIKEQNRIRQQKRRERQKQALLENNHVTSRDRHALEVDIEEEIEVEKDKNRIDYQLIADMYNRICVSYPSIKSLSDSRKKAIKARMKTYSIDDFHTLFEMAEESDFLKGANNNDWSANFDWLIKDANMAKVLDGNYENRKSSVGQNTNRKQTKAEELNDFYNMASEWAEGE